MPESTAGSGGNTARESILIAHSSDLHLASHHYDDSASSAYDMARLHHVLAAAREAGADALLLAGDIFDHNRVKLGYIDEVGRALGDARLPIVILPGNHDCLTPNSVYRRGGLSDVPNVEVLGVTANEAVALASLDLEVWGKPHLDYDNMSPLTDPRPRGTSRWQIAMAHGHWVSRPDDLHRSWLIRQEELSALRSDYLALGHWDVPTRIGSGALPAYYSGSPDLAKTINLVRLDTAVTVTRWPIAAYSGNAGAGIT